MPKQARSLVQGVPATHNKRALHIQNQAPIFLNNKRVIQTQYCEIIAPGTSPIDFLRVLIHAEKCGIMNANQVIRTIFQTPCVGLNQG